MRTYPALAGPPDSRPFVCVRLPGVNFHIAFHSNAGRLAPYESSALAIWDLIRRHPSTGGAFWWSTTTSSTPRFTPAPGTIVGWLGNIGRK